MRWKFIKYFVTFDAFSGSNKDGNHSNKACQKLAKIAIQSFLVTLLGLCFLCPHAQSKVIRLNEVDLAGKHFPYLYQWYDSELQPKAIVIAIHGLTLHGLVYDHLARHLAEQGMLVLAPDLPGYGRRWHKEDASYAQAQETVLAIAQAAKATYKNLPVICLGESLGANLALGAAQIKPDLVDGIVLSSPALKTRMNLTPKSIISRVNMVVSFVKPDTVVDLSPYMRAYASEDPGIIQTMLNDPLIHRQLKCQELWDSYQSMKPVFKQASLISKTTPVLIFQGSQDKILQPKAIIKLVSSLNSDDQTVKWYKNRGHMILAECQPKADVLATLDDWVQTHINGQWLEVKTSTAVPVTSSLPPLTQTLINAKSN